MVRNYLDWLLSIPWGKSKAKPIEMLSGQWWTIVGLLFSANGLFTGPLADAAGGVDLSFISAGLTGGVLYWLFEMFFPEKDVRALQG